VDYKTYTLYFWERSKIGLEMHLWHLLTTAGAYPQAFL
jgi:hypothetical protein